MPDSPGNPDGALVRASLAGDAGAYRELVRRYQGHVYALAHHLLGDWSHAQDVAQETFLRAHRELSRLRDPERFAPWLRRIAVSVTLNWLRAHRPDRIARESLDERLEPADAAPGPAELVERRELSDAVLAAVAELPPRYRLPLTMFHLDGLSAERVADFLGVPPGTARSLLHRARERLRPALRPLAQEVAPMLDRALERHRLGEEFTGRVIRGLETVRWGAGEWENSPLGALAAALAAVGEHVPYEFLMGVSGAAFRVQMFQPRWCPSAPHPRCGFDCLETAFAALAYELVDLPVKPDDVHCVERVREEVVKSIDAGVPAFFTSLEESLIVGYEDEGRRLLLRLYGAPEEGYVPWRLVRGEAEGAETYPESFVLDWPHLSFGVLRRKPAPPDRRRSLVRSLELALELGRTPAFGLYASGFAAFEQWIAGLRDPSRFADPSRREAEMHANAHCWYGLCDARSAAGPYLRGVAAELGGRAAEPLARAADLYEESCSRVLRLRCPTEVAPMRWKLGPEGDWTQRQRDEQAALLEQALVLERRALDSIAAGLAAVERSPGRRAGPPTPPPRRGTRRPRG